MPGRLLGVVLLLGLTLGAAVAGASSSAPGPPSSARALVVQVLSAAGSGGSAGAVSAPPDAVAFGGFGYPDDGSVASLGSVTAKASAVTSKGGSSASASAEVGSVSLFGGEITADAVVGAAHAAATPTGGSGDFSGAVVSNLVALGQAVGSSPGTQVTLADWGYLTVMSQSVVPGSAQGAPSYQESMTALVVHLTADHGGLAAGSEIQIGYAQAAAQGATPAPPAPPPTTTAAPSPPPPPPTATTTGPTPTSKPTATTKKAPPAAATDRTTTPAKPVKKKPEPRRPPEAPEAGSGPRLPVVHNAPLTVVPKLTGRRYLFPVYGPSSYTDTFGAPRADVSWHHGDDIFAPLGAPLLAVADGVVFSVGWNHIGGYRLWLRDQAGNQFYYAHLSAYSPLAVNGRRVRAGDVLGFVGNTGDAVGTPYHVHFEVHPKALLQLGYDGAVDPTQYLDAWRRLQNVRLAPPGWALPASKPKRGVKPAPPPGAILLQADDISTASGLNPASMHRVLAPLEHEGDGFLVGAHQTAPNGPRPVRVH